MESKKVAAFIAEGRFFIYRAYCWHLFGAPTVINLKPFNMQIPPPPRQPEDSLSLSPFPLLSFFFFFFPLPLLFHRERVSIADVIHTIAREQMPFSRRIRYYLTPPGPSPTTDARGTAGYAPTLPRGPLDFVRSYSSSFFFPLLSDFAKPRFQHDCTSR